MLFVVFMVSSVQYVAYNVDVALQLACRNDGVAFADCHPLNVAVVKGTCGTSNFFTIEFL